MFVIRKSNEILFIGDSTGDYKVSMKNNLYFIGVENFALQNINCTKIVNLQELINLISLKKTNNIN